ncbi:MAG: DUF2807 domain-containing protein [Chitinophagales bacterium]|nr:DUF2807 domain-containing protein [Chitinophagales bacterium]
MHAKSIFYYCLTLVSINLISCNFQITSNEGKGPLIDKTYQYKFTALEQDNGIESKIYKSNEHKVVVNAPNDIIDNILVEMEGDHKVHIHVKNNSNISTAKVTVKIYTPYLTELDASSAAEVQVIDTFVAEKIVLESGSGAEIKGSFKALTGNVKASSGSSIDVNILGETISVESTSGSEITLSGLAKQTDMKASSGSQIDGEKFVSQSSNLESSSGAEISLGVTLKTIAKSSSGSNIDIYKRSNQIEISKEVSSGGSVDLH